MPRRIADYPDAFLNLNVICSYGSSLTLFSTLVFFVYGVLLSNSSCILTILYSLKIWKAYLTLFAIAILKTFSYITRFDVLAKSQVTVLKTNLYLRTYERKTYKLQNLIR